MSATTIDRKNIRRVAGASLVGTTVEFYDFFIFGTAAALVFGKLFFPDLNPLAGTLASFATFGVAFVARPLGAVIFGHYGDKISRKSMLIISLMLMGLSTVAIGLLPTYAQVGILAPLLLVLCRFAQGIALGGEWGGAVLMAAEHAPKEQRAYYAAWPQVGVPLGLVLSTFAFWLVQQLPDEAVQSWGWRVPFIASAILVIVGLYIRLKVEESPAFKNVKQTQKVEKFPAGVVFKEAPGRVFRAALVKAAPNIPFYMVTVFALTYGEQAGVDRQVMLLAVCAAAFVQMFTIPFFARYADRYGRRPVLLVGSLCTALMAFPFFWLVDTGSTFLIILAMMLALPLCHTLTYGPVASFIPEVFPTRLRYSGAGISYNIGNLLFSAPVPFISAWLLSIVDGPWVLSVYIIVGAVISFVAILASRESRNDEIHWDSQPGDIPAELSTADGSEVRATTQTKA